MIKVRMKNRKNKKSKGTKQEAKKFRLPIDFLLIALLFPLFVITMLTLKKPATLIKIPPEKTSETKFWKTYQNNDFYFSFKYPDYMLDNFHVETFSNTFQKVKGTASAKKQSSNGIPTYNVFFEANAWKFNGALDDFVKNGPLKIKGYKTREILLNDMHGLRVTNTDNKKADAYFYYNIFKKDNFIYNFALLTDDKVLIGANSDLLNEIMSTAKFE